MVADNAVGKRHIEYNSSKLNKIEPFLHLLQIAAVHTYIHTLTQIDHNEIIRQRHAFLSRCSQIPKYLINLANVSITTENNVQPNTLRTN